MAVAVENIGVSKWLPEKVPSSEAPREVMNCVYYA
jgi:hypothetical protein